MLFVIFGFPLITMDRVDLDFTAIGHFASILIGLCFYPMTRTPVPAQPAIESRATQGHGAPQRAPELMAVRGERWWAPSPRDGDT